MSLWMIVLLQIALLAYALVGGVFLAFSDFIMRALAGASRAGGVQAMQSINREVYRRVFMTLFLGLAPVSLVIVIYGVTVLPIPAGALIAGAGVTYLLGCFGVTVLVNVPMNNALANMAYESEEARVYWEGHYVPRWSFWNSLRAAACIIASVFLLVGLHWVAPR